MHLSLLTFEIQSYLDRKQSFVYLSKLPGKCCLNQATSIKFFLKHTNLLHLKKANNRSNAIG